MRSLVAADFNGDGRSDIAAGVAAGSGVNEGMEVFLARADGAFVPAVGFDGPAGTLLTADLNNDNRADLVAASPSFTGLLVALGVGNGAFVRSVVPGPAWASIAAADVDGDTQPDVVALQQGQARVSVLPGRGDGTFAAAASYTIPVAPQQALPTSVAAGDVDGDGRPDVFAAAPQRNMLYFLANAGGGALRAATRHPLDDSLPLNSTGAGTAGVGAAYDVNGDGLVDLVRADTVRRTLNVRLGRGRNASRPFATDVRLLADPDALGLAVADVNGDGRADIISGSATADAVAVFLASPITGVWVDGPSWSASFRDAIESAGLGEATWDSGCLRCGAGAAAVGGRQPNYYSLRRAGVGRAVGPDGRRRHRRRVRVLRVPLRRHRPRATWTFASTPRTEKLLIELSGVNEAAGSGGPVGPMSLRLNALPGDVNRDGRVDGQDLVYIRTRLGTSPAQPGARAVRV